MPRAESRGRFRFLNTSGGAGEGRLDFLAGRAQQFTGDGLFFFGEVPDLHIRVSDRSIITAVREACGFQLLEGGGRRKSATCLCDGRLHSRFVQGTEL